MRSCFTGHRAVPNMMACRHLQVNVHAIVFANLPGSSTVMAADASFVVDHKDGGEHNPRIHAAPANITRDGENLSYARHTCCVFHTALGCDCCDGMMLLLPSLTVS